MVDQHQTNSHTLFVLHEGDSPNTLRRTELLRQAACERAIPFVAINSLKCDHTDLPKLKAGDMLFNCGRGSTMLETLLTVPGIATFRSAQPRWVDNGSDTVVFSAVCDREGLPGPKTIYHLPDCNDQLLRYVDYLGGLPIVLKASGGTGGLGVVYCPDEPSLLSTVDFARSLDHQFIMREYIPHQEMRRVVVLGGDVLCVIFKRKRNRDFRTGSSIDGANAICENPGEAVTSLAIQAARTSEYEFCGVDIIDHPDRGPLLIENNPPSDFAVIQDRTGVDIAGPVVEYLARKSNKILVSL